MQEKLISLLQELQRNKNEQCFEQLYQLTHTQLFYSILRILKNKEHAEECLQEVYLKIWKKLESYDQNKAQVSTWMSSIARNQAIDYLRAKKIITGNDDEIEQIEDYTVSQFDALNQEQDNQALYGCLKQLPQETMDVLLMSYFKGLTYEVIAKKVNKPESTIKSWVRRSLPILKDCLKKSKANL